MLSFFFYFKIDFKLKLDVEAWKDDRADSNLSFLPTSTISSTGLSNLYGLRALDLPVCLCFALLFELSDDADALEEDDFSELDFSSYIDLSN